jgi:hypothetical protein
MVMNKTKTVEVKIHVVFPESTVEATSAAWADDATSGRRLKTKYVVFNELRRIMWWASIISIRTMNKIHEVVI